MNTTIKRGLVSIAIILIYFTGWKAIRGFVTSGLVVPQIEYAITHCDETIAYNQSKSTSLFIHLLNRDKNEYETFGYISPAGFYLLFGLVFIVLMGAGKFYYYFLLGFHAVFWVLSTATILPGLCYHPVFLHLTFAGIKYFTPFVTFLILILLISPKLKRRLEIEETLPGNS